MFESLRIMAATLPAVALWVVSLGKWGESISVRTTNRLVVGAAYLGLVASIVSLITTPAAGPLTAGIGGRWSEGLSIYIDNISVIMLTLVSFLAVLITRYSATYLAGQAGQRRFMIWLARTIAAVLTLVIAGNLLLFFLAWALMSLALHQLLTFNSDRPAAILAARKKFIVSRCGDLCLIGALIASYSIFGTWQFQNLFAAAAHRHAAGGENLIVWLLVAAACLKSAQFPFHSWLPDTMETPTPVSALMHAGIINAGGFLLIRFSPLLIHCPVPLMTLAVIGIATTLTGSLAMMTQTSIKRQLAYSTVAQMGYMMIECGLGAFGLALLHLVAHAFYKSHSFLASGSTVRNAPIAQFRRLYRHHHTAANIAAALTAAALLIAVTVLSIHGLIGPNHLPLLTAAGIAVCLLIWRAVAGRYAQAAMIRWVLGLGVLAAAYPLLSRLSDAVLAANSMVGSGAGSGNLPPEPWAFSLLLCVPLVLLGFLQWLMISGQKPTYLRALYVHALSGFYIGVLANRLTTSIWCCIGNLRSCLSGADHAPAPASQEI
jgi:NAD(P)H-quinone oxidoreductase subunit 5